MTMQGDELKAARAQLGLSQEQMGEKLGLTGKFVGMMERGTAIEPRTEYAVRYLLAQANLAERVDGHLSNIKWTEAEGGHWQAEIGSFTAWLTPQTKGRYSISTRHRDGFSPPWPVWESTLEAAKASAILNVQHGMMDIAERQLFH